MMNLLWVFVLIGVVFLGVIRFMSQRELERELERQAAELSNERPAKRE